MSKIVMLHSVGFLNTFYTEKNLKDLKNMGEFVMNPQKANPTPEYACELLKDADVAITSWGCPKFDKAILASSPNLKAVLHSAGSIKGLLSPEWLERGIRATNAAQAIGKGVAETALGMTITSLKNLWTLAKNTSMGEWDKGKEQVKELYNVTIGVIGAGYVGRHYIKLLQNFDVNVLLFDPTVSAEQAAQIGAKKAELHELLKTADLISIHAPSILATDRMFNSETLAMMKDDAILINTARDSIIDEPALVAELRKGRLFACLDLTAQEPPEVDDPIRSLPNVILTPHIAGAVNNGMKRIGEYIVDDLKRYLAGQRMKGEVDFSRLDTIA